MTEGKTSSLSLTILYDNVRWEEKALYESAKRKGVHINNIDCKNLIVNLNKDFQQYREKIIL
ncbi:MAG TPA: lysine biosynthesis enzyme LysX, partial [Nitrososphaeraceae archaeon]|nr:lysine biosynthesis enzyme LysX [Nitrososphaeraceae archaeon]